MKEALRFSKHLKQKLKSRKLKSCFCVCVLLVCLFVRLFSVCQRFLFLWSNCKWYHCQSIEVLKYRVQKYDLFLCVGLSYCHLTGLNSSRKFSFVDPWDCLCDNHVCRQIKFQMVLFLLPPPSHSPYAFTSFSCLISWVRTSRTVLNKSGETSSSCLPILEGTRSESMLAVVF